MELEGITFSEINQVEKCKYQIFHSFVYENKAKLREQNSSRLRDSKKELVVTKGEGCERAGGEGRRRGLMGIMFCTHDVGVMGKTV